MFCHFEFTSSLLVPLLMSLIWIPCTTVFLLNLNVCIQRAGCMRKGIPASTFFCGEPAPWIFTTAFLQFDAVSQWIRLYGDIPEPHKTKADRFRPCGRGLRVYLSTCLGVG